MAHKNKHAEPSGLSKKDRKALKAKEDAIMAELEARAAKPVKPKSKKAKGDATAPDLTALKRKALKALIADKTNGALRKAAKAELERRLADETAAEYAEAAAKEAAKPVKPKREPVVTPYGTEGMTAPSTGAIIDAVNIATFTPAAVIEAADKVLSDPNASEGAIKSARAARSKALEAMSPDELKARVKSKTEARKALEATADDVDRSDDNAVKAYNVALDALGGGRFLTSDAEKAERDAMLDIAEVDPRVPLEGDVTVDIDDLPGKKAKGKKPKPAQVADESTFADADSTFVHAQIVDEVETDKGRVFAAGVGSADDPTAQDGDLAVDFGKPSEAPQPLSLEEGRNGYKIMVLKADGTPDPKTVRQFTRVTTYIDNLEDKSNLDKWKQRVLLEGVALHDTPEPGKTYDGEPAIARVRDLMHTRDVALAKAAKADRKGKLEPGELGKIEQAAIKAFKDALNLMAEELLELGGVHEKANRGTNLHALAELYDAEGLDPIEAKLKSGEITPTDYASIAAYGEAMEAAGIKVVASEVVIVNDGRMETNESTGKLERVGSYAGRFDRIVMAKRPGDTRSSKVIADIKSGRLDYGLAKVEQQVAMYADGKAYDLETGERTPLGAVKSWGLVIHLPQGEGTCTIHVLDLNRGRKANALSAAVRTHRAEARKIVLGPDLAKPEAVSADA